MPPVAQYLRMSREHQNYSLEYQAVHNAAYAADHGFDIVQTYSDAGLSGLTFRNRPGLGRLIADVSAGAADFKAVLVYDVSRWGRFQDVDQAAHYEFICRQAGVAVLYTAESFGEEGSFSAGILKHLKRVMAADFSRDLSAKIHRAKTGLRGLGFWTGGPPGYGLRRRMVDFDTRAPHLQMEAGEHKALRRYRTVLVHGPDHEVAIVRRIYRQFLFDGLKMVSLAERLNAEGVPAEGGARWTLARIQQVLTNEKYSGAIVGQKTTHQLGKRVPRPRDAWERVDGSVEPIVDRGTFDAVQAQFRRPKARVSNEALIRELKQVLEDYGALSIALIDRHPVAHCAGVYKKRFGGMLAAYRRAGFTPTRRQTAAHDHARRNRPWTLRSRLPPIAPEEAWRQLERHYAERGFVSCNTIDNDPALPCAEWFRRRFGPMAEIYARLGHVPTEGQSRYFRGRGADRGRDAGVCEPPRS